jgi:mRNA interferase MazF
MQKGDIIIIPFPFTDLSGSKLRPSVVLFTDKRDVTICFITSQLKWKDEFDFEIFPNQENGLKVNSIVRLTKISTIDKSLVIGKLGNLSTVEIIELNKNLKTILKLN